MFDYRQCEEDAKKLQRRVDTLSAKERPTASERDEIVSLMGQIHALEGVAGKIKEAELVELRAAMARGGTPLGVGEYGTGDRDVRDFYDYLKTGDASGIRDTAMSTGDGSGGYLIPDVISSELVEARRKVDPIYKLATKIDMRNGSDTMFLPRKASHGVAVEGTELSARSEQVEPTLESRTMGAYDYWTDQRISQTALDSYDFDKLLTRWVGEDILETLGVDICAGNGSNKPLGMFSATAVYPTTFSGSATTVLNSTPAKLFWTLPSRYRPNAVWLASSATIAVLCGFASPSNANVPLVDQSGDTFKMLGKPVLEAESAPALGAGLYSLGFGDVGAAYAIGTHREISILRDPLTCTPLVRYYGLGRFAGSVLNPEAFVLCRCATV